MNNAAEIILSKTRQNVKLPCLGVSVEVRALRTREMLEAGILPLVKVNAQDTTGDNDEAVKGLLRAARDLLITCAVKPRVYSADDYRSALRGNVSIDDIPDEDVLAAYRQIVSVSDTRFFGVDRTAFDPDENEALLTGQMQMSYYIDGIAQRYHISPIEVMGWKSEDISIVCAIIEAADAEAERKKANAK